jgi:outer membrane receptor for ferrienterochelin and colicins
LHLKSLFVLLFILTFSLVVPYIAQSVESPADLTELSLEDLLQVTVYSASKFEQKTTEAPSSVTIITASDIEKYGYRTLADILSSVRSFYTLYDRNYRYVGVRGFNRPGDYNSRILLLIDGVRQNDTIFDQALIGTEFVLDVDLIDRIEIIRGPGSSLYGTNAIFAVINILTKKGRNIGGLQVSGEAGTFDTYRGRISYGKDFSGGVETLLSTSYYESKGDERLYYKEYDEPATNNGIAKDSDLDRLHSFFGKISYQGFTLEGAFQNRKKLIPTATYGTVFNDSRTFTIDESAFVALSYDRTYANQWTLVGRLFYSYYDYHGQYIYDDADGESDEPSKVKNKDYGESHWWGAELQASRKFFENHRVIFGAEYRDSFQQDQSNYDIDVYLDSKEDSENWSVYIQDEFEIVSNLILNAGVRYDHYTTFGGTTNPRLAVIYHPIEKTVLKLLYGTAFRAPSAYELYYSDGYYMKANPGLEHETITTYEVILEQRMGEHLRGTINGFYYDVDNLINPVVDPEDGLFMFKNSQEAEASGIELELEGVWSHGWKGRLSYTYQEAEDKQTGEWLTNSPKHLAKLNIIVPLIQNKIFLGIEEQYTSKRKTLGGDHVDDFFITNVTLFSHQFFKTLKVSASIYNLFDEKYSDPGSAEHLQDSIEQDGRSFRFKLTYTF